MMVPSYKYHYWRRILLRFTPNACFCNIFYNSLKFHAFNRMTYQTLKYNCKGYEFTIYGTSRIINNPDRFWFNKTFSNCESPDSTIIEATHKLEVLPVFNHVVEDILTVQPRAILTRFQIDRYLLHYLFHGIEPCFPQIR